MKVYFDTSVLIALARTEDRFNSLSLEFVRELQALGSRITVASPFFLEMAKAIQLRGIESASAILQTIDRHEIELATPDLDRLLNLADRYAGMKVMSIKYRFDLLHYASATLLGCSHLASWDHDHFNERIAQRVNRANSSMHLPTLKVGDPSTLMRSIGLGQE